MTFKKGAFIPKLDIPEIFKNLQNTIQYKERDPLFIESEPAKICKERIYEEFNRYDNINNKTRNTLKKNSIKRLNKHRSKSSLVRE